MPLSFESQSRSRLSSYLPILSTLARWQLQPALLHFSLVLFLSQNLSFKFLATAFLFPTIKTATKLF